MIHGKTIQMSVLPEYKDNVEGMAQAGQGQGKTQALQGLQQEVHNQGENGG